MKKLLFILIPVFLIILFVVTASQTQTKLRKSDTSSDDILKKSPGKEFTNDVSAHLNKGLSCKTCHIAEYPTKRDPGLAICPRENMIESDYHPPTEGPDIVVINEMSENYTGVTFSHRVHSQMSEMSGGCSGCHHNNTTGLIQNCSNCHSRNRNREDITVPDLKAAFHLQCTMCHQQWSGENGCNDQCHKKKGTETLNDVSKEMELKKGKLHPLIEEPKKLIWETNSGKGKMVTFFHDEHIQLFKLNCTKCHSQENCTKCHEKKQKNDLTKPFKTQKTFEEHHKPCVNCHDGNKCEKCHQDKEMTKFNHEKSTGWSLSPYHNRVECSRCHGNSMPYKKLDKNCTPCHKNFGLGIFNHKSIGLTLSASHIELECKSCHTPGEFTKKPTCTECHDDKSYPAQLPGTKGKK